jgi:Tol biopolymer transport system component
MNGRPNLKPPLLGQVVLSMLRTLAMGLAAAILTASSCKDNLGKGKPGPATFRASIGTNDLQANGASAGSIYGVSSSDGTFVAFQSKANNLAVPGTNFTEIFVRDRQTDAVGNISRLDLRLPQTSQMADCTGPAISPNGRYIAWLSKAVLVGVEASPQATTQIFLFDRFFPFTPLKRVLTAAWPDRDLTFPSLAISPLGHPLVVFESQAGNLGFANAGFSNQIYVADMSFATPTITLLSRDVTTATTIAGQACAWGNISADGSTVAFTSTAANLVMPAPPPGVEQVYVATVSPVVVELVSRASGAGGTEGDQTSTLPSISGDGRYVAFVSKATTLTPSPPATSLVVRDRNPAAPLTTLAASDPFSFPLGALTLFDSCSISSDGRFIAYRSVADSQIYVLDLLGGRTLASRSNFGDLSNNPQFFENPVISGDGRWVFWNSKADNLVPDDTNGVQDVFGFGPIH